MWYQYFMKSELSPNILYRKTFSFSLTNWFKLKEVALEKGFPNRNLFITTTLKNIMEEHQQAKSNDLEG